MFVSHSADLLISDDDRIIVIETKVGRDKSTDFLSYMEKREDELVQELARRGYSASCERSSEGRWAVGLLSAFRWFCHGTDRVDIDMVIADIRRDIKAMRSNGWRPWFIRCSVTWNAFSSVIAIVWCGIERTASAWRRVRGKPSGN